MDRHVAFAPPRNSTRLIDGLIVKTVQISGGSRLTVRLRKAIIGQIRTTVPAAAEERAFPEGTQSRSPHSPRARGARPRSQDAESVSSISPWASTVAYTRRALSSGGLARCLERSASPIFRTSCCVGLRDAPHIHFRRVARILPRVTRRTGAGSENRRRAPPREEKRGHALRCACYSYRCSDGVEGLGSSHPSIFRRDMSGCQSWRTAG